MKCRGCGNEVSAGSKFCKYCGAPVQQMTETEKHSGQGQSLVKCHACGAIVRAGNAYCTKCGIPISATKDGNKGKQIKIGESGKTKSGKSIKIIIAIISTIVILLVALIIAYFVRTNGGIGKKDSTYMEMGKEDSEDMDVNDEIEEESIDEDETRQEVMDSPKGRVEEGEQMSGMEDADDVKDGIDVEEAVRQMHNQYGNIITSISTGSYRVINVENGITAYYENAVLKAVVVAQGFGNADYSQSFYYGADSLFLAYYEGVDSHRLYFQDGKMIRWRYCPDTSNSQKGTNYDLETTSEYYRWESNALEESEEMRAVCMDALKDGNGTQEYILDGSDSRYISKSELQELTAEQCRLARNEIYARHGRKFDDEYLQSYFDSLKWYTPLIDPDEFDESILNSYEIANRDLIVEYEAECGFVLNQ